MTSVMQSEVLKLKTADAGLRYPDQVELLTVPWLAGYPGRKPPASRPAAKQTSGQEGLGGHCAWNIRRMKLTYSEEGSGE
ncbi:hypothetical protein [Streptomyces sp. NPDC058412]|uniref:hypothetical protein n=1 Tax=Streptomyces sp. NPDC058412 TaxID=3346486 RepID=UPI0036647DAD